MKSKFLFLFIVLGLQSCTTNEVYHDFQNDFKDNRWSSNDSRVFEFANDDLAGLYTIKIQLAHIYDFEFSKIPLEITIISPSGTNEIFSMDLVVKDATGKDIGDCTGDICDVYAPIQTNIKLQKGTYTIEVKSAFEGPYLPNILGVGVIVEKIQQ
jgi:gliding motility-associated lipoprotein GldH